VDGFVGGPGQQDVLVNPGDLIGLTAPAEQVLVGLELPCPKTRAGPGARGAALLTVDAIVGTEFVFEVERAVALA